MSAPVGSLATEAALLLDALAGRLETLRPETGAGPTGPAAADPDRGEVAEPGEVGDQGSVSDRPPLSDAGPSGGAAEDGVCPQCGHDPSATTSCTACPLCRLLALLRGERPETTARLLDGALTVIQALRALLPEPAERYSGAGAAGGAAAGAGGGAGGAERASGGSDASASSSPGARADHLAENVTRVTGGTDFIRADGDDQRGAGSTGPRRSGGLERIVVR